jgi:hypothetical protein
MRASLEEVLDEKLRVIERKIAELSAFRENLRYYRERLRSCARPCRLREFART